MIGSNKEPSSGYWCEKQYGWVFDEELKRMVPAIRCRYTPTLESYETPWVPTYKMDEAERKQEVKPVAEREPFWGEEDDAPAAKRSRLY